jgi:ABC-type transport system involved in multi-copper enzyme maturation permease subunit
VQRDIDNETRKEKLKTIKKQDMTQLEQIEIPLSKKKILLTFFGATVFVGLGVLFLINPSMFTSTIFRNPTIIFIGGLVSVLFFGLVAVTVFRKLSDKKAGLIINKEGIIDNSSGVSVGLVLWSDIKEIKTCSVASQQFLMVIVKNPQDYIDKVSNSLKRKAIEMNYKTYGSPISISTNSLQTNFDNLYNLLASRMKEYKMEIETVEKNVTKNK